MSEQHSPEPSLEPMVALIVERHVARLIAKWATALGVINVGFILTACAYIFFVLPRNVAAEARQLVLAEVATLKSDAQKSMDTFRSDAQRSVEQLLGNLKPRIDELRETSAGMKEQARRLDEDMKEMQTKADGLKSKLSDSALTVAGANAQALIELQKNPAASDILTTLSKVKADVAKLQDLKAAESTSLEQARGDIAKIQGQLMGEYQLLNSNGGYTAIIVTDGLNAGHVMFGASNLGDSKQLWRLVPKH